MKFEIAIPSYKRSQKLKNQTLAFLRTQPVEWNKITVFLKNDEELASYSNDISGVKFVVCHTEGLAQKRTFIRSYYPEGTLVLGLDDDIKRLKSVRPLEFVPFVERMFELAQQEGCSMWGLYPTNTTNLFYNKDRIAIGFQFLVSCFYGFVARPLTYPEFVASGQDDKWLSLYTYKQEGKLLRYEGAVPDTTYQAVGGLSSVRKEHADKVEDGYKKLAEMFPDLCKYKIKKNGRPDVIFKRTNRIFIPLYSTQQETTTQQESRCEADLD